MSVGVRKPLRPDALPAAALRAVVRGLPGEAMHKRRLSLLSRPFLRLELREKRVRFTLNSGVAAADQIGSSDGTPPAATMSLLAASQMLGSDIMGNTRLAAESAVFSGGCTTAVK